MSFPLPPFWCCFPCQELSPQLPPLQGSSLLFSPISPHFPLCFPGEKGPWWQHAPCCSWWWESGGNWWWDVQVWAKLQNGEFNGEPPAALAQHAAGESTGGRCVWQFVSASVLFLCGKGIQGDTRLLTGFLIASFACPLLQSCHLSSKVTRGWEMSSPKTPDHRDSSLCTSTTTLV